MGLNINLMANLRILEMEPRKRELIAGLYGLLDDCTGKVEEICKAIAVRDICNGMSCTECPFWRKESLDITMEAIDDLTGPIDEKGAEDGSEKR